MKLQIAIKVKQIVWQNYSSLRKIVGMILTNNVSIADRLVFGWLEPFRRTILQENTHAEV